MMPRYLALLRGVNVGGRNKVAMADLRQLAESLGHAEVTTYVQSGNLIFSAPAADTGALADALEQEITARLGVRSPVVVLSGAELTQAIAGNPFPDEPDPKRVHAVFCRGSLNPEARQAVEAAQRKSRDAGSADEVVVSGRTLYLHTPDGYGRSDLAAGLFRPGARVGGTARNWVTVTRLMAMLG
ncbi:MAG: DUF1697 domain-containing protein [Streptosporangiaceae bacterium]